MEFLSRIAQSAVDAFYNPLYTVVAITLITLLLATLGYCFIRDYGLPPGPTGIPLLGYWPFLRSDICHLQQMALKKKYGDVFSFRVTGKLFINLASKKVLREAHITKSDCFMERTADFNIISKTFANGVVFSNGEKWQIIRKFFLNQFRERGMSIYKENTAEAMNETLNSLIDDLRNNVDKEIDILNLLTKKSNCIIRQTLFGPHTPVTESQIHTLQENYRLVSTIFHSSNLVLTGDIAEYLVAPFLPFYREAFKIHKKTTNTFLKIIDEHKNTFDSNHIRDIIDSYIEERKQRELKKDPTAVHFTDEALVGNLLQFVGDGVLNVATFITFILTALLDHPEEQEKIYKELIDICGEDRNPSFADRNQLTYTNAFLLEAQRTANFVPLFPSLECTKETTIGGYRVPKGAITMPNIYALHIDPNEYEEPEKFNPLRFISKDGKPREDSPITFGVGKRVCLGEGFVLMQVFLFITAMVKNFKLSYYQPKSQFEVQRTRTLHIRVIPRK